jgi:hypothetical protein
MLFEVCESFRREREVPLRIVVEACQSSDILDRLYAYSPDKQCGYQRAANNEQIVVKVLVEYSCVCLQSVRRGGGSPSLGWGSCADGHKSIGRHNARMDDVL